MINVLVSSLSRDFGGVESLFLMICKNCKSTDLHFDFICTDKSAAREDEFVDVGAKVYHLPRPGKDLSGYQRGLKQILKNGNYQIFHVNLTRFRFPGEIILAKSCGLKVVLHSHATQIYKTGNQRRDLLRKAEQVAFRPIVLAASDLNIACCKTAGEYLYGKTPYTILYNGIETKKYRFDEAARKKVRAEFGITDDEKVLGHIGRFSDEKNHEFLLQIFKRIYEDIPNTKLLCVGNGDLFEQVKNQAKQLGIEGQVIFAGQRSDIPDLLSAMDVFVFPSKHEAFPMTLIEAQANGLPCIVSDCVTREIDIGNYIGFHNIGDGFDKWKMAVELVNMTRDIEDETEINRFNIDTMIEKLRQLYGEYIK